MLPVWEPTDDARSLLAHGSRGFAPIAATLVRLPNAWILAPLPVHCASEGTIGELAQTCLIGGGPVAAVEPSGEEAIPNRHAQHGRLTGPADAGRAEQFRTGTEC